MKFKILLLAIIIRDLYGLKLYTQHGDNLLLPIAFMTTYNPYKSKIFHGDASIISERTNLKKMEFEDTIEEWPPQSVHFISNKEIAVLTKNWFLRKIEIGDAGEITDLGNSDIYQRFFHNLTSCKGIEQYRFEERILYFCTRYEEGIRHISFVDIRKDGPSFFIRRDFKLSSIELQQGEVDIKLLAFGRKQEPLFMVYNTNINSKIDMNQTNIRFFNYSDTNSFSSLTKTYLVDLQDVSLCEFKDIINYNGNHLTILAKSCRSKSYAWYFLDFKFSPEEGQVLLHRKRRVKHIKNVRGAVFLTSSSILIRDGASIISCNMVRLKKRDPCQHYNHLIKRNEKIDIRDYWEVGQFGVFVMRDPDTKEMFTKIVVGQDNDREESRESIYTNSIGVRRGNLLVLVSEKDVKVKQLIMPFAYLDHRNITSPYSISLITSDETISTPNQKLTPFTIKFVEDISKIKAELSEASSVEIHQNDLFITDTQTGIMKGNIVDVQAEIIDAADHKGYAEINVHISREIRFQSKYAEPEIRAGYKTLIEFDHSKHLTVNWDCDYSIHKIPHFCLHKVRDILESPSKLVASMIDMNYAIVAFRKKTRRGNTQITRKKQNIELRLVAPFNLFSMEKPLVVIKSKLKISISPLLTEIVKLSIGNYAIVTCSRRKCIVSKISSDQDKIIISKNLGSIDRNILKASKFCPMKVEGIFTSSNKFYIISKCPGDTYQDVHGVRLKGRSLNVEERFRISSFLNLQVCDLDYLVASDRDSNTLSFYWTTIIPEIQHENIKLDVLGIQKLQYLNCKYRSILVAGRSRKNDSITLIYGLAKQFSAKKTYSALNLKESLIKGVVRIKSDFNKIRGFLTEDIKSDDGNTVFFITSKQKNKILATSLTRGHRLEVSPGDIRNHPFNFKSVLRFRTLGGEVVERRFNLFNDVTLKSVEISHIPKSRKPRLSEDTFDLSSLIGIRGYVESIRIHEDDRKHGFELVDMIVPYSQLPASTGKKKSLNYFVQIAKHKDLRIAAVDTYEYRGKVNLRIWKNCDEFVVDYFDKGVYKSDFIQIGIYRIGKLIYFYHVDTSHKGTLLYLRGINIDGSITSYPTIFMHAVLSETRMFVKYNKDGIERMYFIGKTYDQASKQIYLVIYKLYKLKDILEPHYALGVIEGDLSHYSIIEDDFKLYIVFVSKGNRLNMRSFDIEKEELEPKLFELKLEELLNIKYLTCEQYIHREIYSDLIGHCFVMTEGTRNYHLQIPRDYNNSQMINRRIYLFREYMIDIETPHWELSDNFLAFYATKKLLIVEMSLNPKKEPKHHVEFSSGILLWRLGQDDGLPLRFLNYTSIDHPFALGTGSRPDEDFLLIDSSDSNNITSYRLYPRLHPQVKVTNFEYIARRRAELIIKGIVTEDKIPIKSLFRTVFHQDPLPNSSYKQEVNFTITVPGNQKKPLAVIHANPRNRRNSTTPKKLRRRRRSRRLSPSSSDLFESDDLLSLTKKLLFTRDIVCFLLGVAFSSLIFIIFMCFGRPKANNIIYMRREEILERRKSFEKLVQGFAKAKDD